MLPTHPVAVRADTVHTLHLGFNALRRLYADVEEPLMEAQVVGRVVGGGPISARGSYSLRCGGDAHGADGLDGRCHRIARHTGRQRDHR
jgi:hypothetical protein